MSIKRPDKYIVDYQEYWMPAGFGLAAGGLYSIPSAVASAVNMAYGKKPDLKKTIGSSSGMAIGIAYDIWARRTGRSATLGAARSAISHLAKPHVKKLVMGPAIPTTATVMAAYTGSKMTHGAIESVVVGTQNPVTGTRSPKPSFIPLPLWWWLF